MSSGDEAKLTPPISLPSAEHRLQALAVSELNWWHSIVRSEFVVQGTSQLPILFVAFLSLVPARRLLSASLVISPTNSPFMVLHASRSLNEASNDEDQDQDQDEGEGEDEDENNEQQDFGDRDKEAMDDDDILDKEGFVDL
jgi:hypothetical protein